MDQGEKIHINRLKVIGIDKIPETCPYFIMEFLAKSLGIKYHFENTSDWWKENEKTIISFLEREHNSYMEKFDLRDIALFVNPVDDIEWSHKKSLMESFDHIHSFKGQLPIKDISFGNKSENSILNIDPGMIYQICLRYSIPTTKNTTFEEIKDEVILTNRKLTPIRDDIIRSVYNLSRKGLINLGRKLKSPNTNKIEEFPIVENTRENIIERIRKDYQIDVSNSLYVSQELKLLEQYSLEDYIPFDINFREYYIKNPYYYRYDKRYFKDNAYSNEGLKTRLLFLNGNNEDSETLVLGVHPSCKEIKTCFNQEELEKDIKRRREIYLSTKDFIISREELCELWENIFTFNTPDKPSLEFSNKHLSMIIRTGEGKLNETIYKIQGYRRERIDRGYSYLLNNLSLAREYLLNIVNLGFILRGYGVCYEEWPIKESTYDLKYQDEVEIKTSLEISSHLENKKYSDFSSKIPVLTGKNILGQDEDICEIKTYDKNSTIGDILNKIIKNTDDVESCMRTNSNYLVLTGWYYINRIFKEDIFELEDLKLIL